LILALSLAACGPASAGQDISTTPTVTPTRGPTPTSLPQRLEYTPGELVDYTAQTGDTLPALAAHFNTSEAEIRTANPQIPLDATTMPPGMPMKIPIYYLPFWGTPFKILPDSQFVNGPGATGFDTVAFVNNRPGWLKDFRDWTGDNFHSGAEIVNIIANNYSISPRVLLALLEYQTGALSQPVPPSGDYPLGEVDFTRTGLYSQLIWAANVLNNGYYGWRIGSLKEFELADSQIERPDPWQDASSVAFQYYFSRHNSRDEYERAIGPDGLARAYRDLFGDPWAVDQPHIPVSLQQPVLSLPFSVGESWNFTGGPHTGWGSLIPWAAVDFAPSGLEGCVQSDRKAVAMADGLVVRSEPGVVMLDLDGDGNEHTGWVILYLHVATVGRVAVGTKLKAGDPIGYPSCEGGTATGTHIHVARKYNGEWIPADSVIPFNMEGWIPHNGAIPYSGTLTRGEQLIIACACSDYTSLVTAGK
jgi:LasA protease